MDKQVSSTQNPYAEPTSLRGGGGKDLGLLPQERQII